METIILELLLKEFNFIDSNKINFILSFLIFRFFLQSKIILSWMSDNSQF